MNTYIKSLIDFDARYEMFYRAVRFIDYEMIPGDIVEFGVYTGRSLALLSHCHKTWLLLGSGVIAARHMTRAATRALRRALPRRRALCTNSKKPRYSGSFSCEMPRCGRSQERSNDHVPSIVLTWISQKPSPSSSRAYSPRPWQTVLCR